MELRPDEAPWTRSFVSHCAEIENGELIVPDRPGWGADVVEDALLAHPPRRP
jgi:L-alanine-DL-glutamate epimerase-like enolase superfamily enzyme